MKGSIFKQRSASGRITWRYQIDAGRDSDGRRIRITQSGFRLEREAYEAMQKAMAELKQRGPVREPVTLAQYLEQWLPYHAKVKPLEPKTAERYASLAAHSTRALGSVRLVDLTAFMLDQLYAKLSERLSPKTVREVHNVLHVALKRAVKSGLIPANPADYCDLPRCDPKEARALSPQELDALHAAAAGTWVDLIIRLAAATGARRGELLALRWSDLDWESRRLRIERSLFEVKDQIGIKATKTRQARVVTLPASIMEYLRLHRQAQAENRALFGPDYRSDMDLIFANPAGDYLLPRSVSRAVARIARQAGLRGVGIHSLRHAHASLLLHAGVPLANVSKRLGHRDTYTTSRIYAHAIPDTDSEVAAVWEKVTSTPRQPKFLAQNGTTSEGAGEESPNESVN